MAINVNGLIAIIVFYVLIFAIGIWAAWKRKSKPSNAEEVMLAGRSIGSFVGFLTLTATWVGGGYINGSAEIVYDSGLLWCQAPIGYAISLILGGIFFARKMRDAGYVTMLDPLQEVFGRRWGSALFFPALAGEMLWSAAILGALGSTLAVMLFIDGTISIIISAAIAVSYTLFGGLAAVAYTDVAQIICIFVGLWLTIPFAMNHEAVRSLSLPTTNWVGSAPTNKYEWGEWTDFYILLMFGGIPWQVYFQRVLSARTSKQAQTLSFAAAFGCFIMVIPSCFMGAIAKATDWEMTAYNQTVKDSSLVLPLVIQYLTPTWVSFFGLGAVSAAVMSSADSSILSASSMFSRNLYKNVFRPKASEREQLIVMRLAVFAFGSLSCFIAIKVNSVYALFNLCGDLVYVLLFPQLTLAVHFPKHVNVYGSIAAFFVGLVIRILGGEKVLGIPAVIKFPWYDEVEKRQLFPFRTISMILSFSTLVFVSWVTKYIFISDLLPRGADFLGVYKNCLVINKEDKGTDNLALDLTSNDSKSPKKTSIMGNSNNRNTYDSKSPYKEHLQSDLKENFESDYPSPSKDNLTNDTTFSLSSQDHRSRIGNESELSSVVI